MEHFSQEEQEMIEKAFGQLFNKVESTDTSTWSDGEIRPIMGDKIAINKEKGFVFHLVDNEWVRFLNILVDRNN